MQTLTRDDTQHGQEYVLKSEADAAIARARAGSLEEAAKAFSDHDMTGREWIKPSLWDTLTNEGCARIRALAGGCGE